MRQQNVIVFSSGKNKRVAHVIVRGLECGVCKATVCGAGEIDIFRNTLTQFLVKDKYGGYHATSIDAMVGENTILIGEISYDA